MECSSSCDHEDFILEFSDDECSYRMDNADNYRNIDDIQKDSERCKSSQLKLGCAQLERDNYCELNDIKLNEIVNRKNNIFVDEGRKRMFSSQNLASSAVPPEKQHGISQNFEKDNIDDKMVNFSKLVNQLLNAKVVIERMCVNSGTIEESAKKNTSSNGSRPRDSVQRYCPKCLTVTVDSRGKTVKKSCSKYSILKGLKSSNFLVEKTEIDFTEATIRYCSNCNEIDNRCGKWAKEICRNCNHQLLYQCNKCKAQYKANSALLYHMHSKCYPRQHKCNQCDFTSTIWENMRLHLINVHLRVHSNIEPPTQLLNVKAVFKKLGKSLAEDTLSRNVRNHKDVNLLEEKVETNWNEYAKLYCRTCKKTKFARIEDTMAKICSDCETAMMYLCTKCNVKHYRRYPYLQFHLDRCKKNGDDMNTFEDDKDIARQKIKDKNEIQLFLDKTPFIVKEFQYADATEKWARCCSKCGLVTASHNDRRCTCSENLLYVCKKCNVKCNSYNNMSYHSENDCFPTHQYKCTQCNYSTTCWSKMQKHFKFIHSDQPLLKCELCSYETKHGDRLKSHTKKMHCKIANKFYCGSCSYSTKYERNLQRHEKLDH